MISKEGLKEFYRKLPRIEKQKLAEALVKVNQGVGMPADQKLLAHFLKGSSYIAKAGSLDALIAFLHDEKVVAKPSPGFSLPMDEKVAKAFGESDGLKEYDEDAVATLKDGEKPVGRKPRR